MIGSIIIAVLGYGLALLLGSLLPAVLIAVLGGWLPARELKPSSFYGGCFLLLVALLIAALTHWLTGV